MHIFFSGIGGAGMTPLALIAKQAGYTVSGSDKQHSAHIDDLIERGITDVHIGQTYDGIAARHAEQPIDWYVFSSAVSIEQPDAPEFAFCHDNNIHMSKRDELLNTIITRNNLKLIAIAGTHGKTTTTAMAIWLLLRNHIPISFLLPAETAFAEMGHYNPDATYFVYEADEFDRNFLAYTPALSVITGVDWDHPDIYPTQDDYNAAFQTFIQRSSHTVLWQNDADKLSQKPGPNIDILNESDPTIDALIALPGRVNRLDAWQVAHALQPIILRPVEDLFADMQNFPGVSRRFEQIAPGVYTDYAHTPPKIRGAIQLGHEIAQDRLVVVYEGLHNTRQHFIKDELRGLFNDIKALYIVPTYLAREDANLVLWTPADLQKQLSLDVQKFTHPAELNEGLCTIIKQHVAAGDTVLCLTAGGGGSLDEWLRQNFSDK